MQPITEFECPHCHHTTLEAQRIDKQGMPWGRVNCTNCPYTWPTDPSMEYVYRGDRLTDEALIGQPCRAIRRAADGKCIRGRNGNMLVDFGNNRPTIVTARRLLKLTNR